jgi:preprotein translocase subunit SecB
MTDTDPLPASWTSADDSNVIKLMSHYVRDLSIENPTAPFGVNAFDTGYTPALRVDVTARNLGHDLHECILSMNARVQKDGRDILVIEMTYGGTYRIRGIPAEFIEAFIMVDAPRDLFPYMRMMVAVLTHSAGLPALHVEAMDFADMYRRAKQPADASQLVPASAT